MDEPILNYDASAIWYDRERAVKKLVFIPESEITPRIIRDLRLIAENDEDGRVRNLAENMVKSYEKQGNFQETEPYKELVAAQIRLTLPKKNYYDPNLMWYDRLDQIKSLEWNIQTITPDMRIALEEIIEKEDNITVKSYAKGICKEYDEFFKTHKRLGKLTGE